MSGLPRIAGDLLQLFGVEPALIGDLDESARSGRSRFWCWYQVAGVLCVSSLQLAAARPAYSARGIAIGWVALLGTFMVIDAPVINDLRLEGYRTGEWTPFWLVAAVLSYLGFALSAWVVARLHRAAPGVLLQYTTTVLAALGLSGMWVALNPGPMPLPHMLFPLVSVTLPYHWRSGLVLAPAVMLLVGASALRRLRLASA